MAQRYTLDRPYSFRFEQLQGYCKATIKGDISSLDIARQYWAEIVHEATKCQPKRLLICEETDFQLSTQDTFTLVSELCALTQFMPVRIAFLNEKADHLDRNKLGEMIASNRGFTCRVFADRAQAEAWLLSGLRQASE